MMGFFVWNVIKKRRAKENDDYKNHKKIRCKALRHKGLRLITNKITKETKKSPKSLMGQWIAKITKGGGRLIITFRTTPEQEEKLRDVKNRAEFVRKALDAYLFTKDDRIKELDDRIKTIEEKIDRILAILENGGFTSKPKKETKPPESAEEKDLQDISSYIFNGIEDLL